MTFAHIERPKKDSPRYLEYCHLTLKEWGAPNNSEFMGVPSPIFVASNDDLIGGITFTLYKSPENDRHSVWLNTLYVKPEYRGRGFAKTLVQTAVSEAKFEKISVLYALTKLLGFYEKLGWEKLTKTEEGTIVKLVVCTIS